MQAISEMSKTDQVRYAIGCAWVICEDAEWRAWARAWVAGEDRSEAASWAAGYYVQGDAARIATEASEDARRGIRPERLAAYAARLAAGDYSVAGRGAFPRDLIEKWARGRSGLAQLDKRVGAASA